MQWIAPAEKDTATDTLEKRLWAAADQFRANSGLTSAQYSTPVLGLIFLRFAEVRFSAQRAKLEKASASSRRGSRLDDPAAYQAEGILYLPPNARFGRLLVLPEGTDVGKAVNEAMRDIEKHNPQLAGVLPRTYNLFSGTLLKELLKKVSEIPASVDYDAFGRIYEYFLGEFARTEGQHGGEFYTPSSIVRLLAEVIEPYHGRILDPACGSGGMFVQSARFVAAHRKNPASELSIHGQEKVAATVALCRMNLAMHGLEGDIRESITYYDDPHEATGRFDFVLANPPFNVNAVDKEGLAAEVGPGHRFPFGLPRTDNANYLWIQLFRSALNEKGRAGFVMANSASDARSSEQDLRRKLIEERAVDVMVAVGPNMFYTVALPCTLWFLDRGKRKTSRADKILFLDARHVYRQIDRAHRDWTEAQVGFLANVVRLYRGEQPDFTLGGDEAKAKLGEIFSPPSAKGVGRKAGGGSYRDIPGLPFFTPRDAPACFYVQDTDKHVSEQGLSKCNSRLYAPDTVFITARGTVGKVALPSVPMAMNQSCYALRGKEGIPQRFLFLMTLEQVEYLKKNTGGATFDTIVVDTFHRMKVVKPPLQLVARFARQTDAMFDAISTLQCRAANLRRTRDLLLPRLLSGKIDLSMEAGNPVELRT